MPLHDVLDRMEDVNRRIAASAGVPGQQHGGAIIDLRQEFSEACGSFLKALTEDLHPVADRELFDEMQAALEDMRQRLSAHQHRWQSAAIEGDPQAYRDSSLAISRMVEKFVVDTRGALSLPDNDDKTPAS